MTGRLEGLGLSGIHVLAGLAGGGGTRWWRSSAARTGQLPAGMRAVPAEGNFPVAVVALHGLFAVSTLVLALLIALGVAAPR